MLSEIENDFEEEKNPTPVSPLISPNDCSDKPERERGNTEYLFLFPVYLCYGLF
jgi:hypothetical protein